MAQGLDFQSVLKELHRFGWFPFGDEDKICDSPSESQKEFYVNNHKLPEPCNRCYKLTISWRGELTEEMLDEIVELTGVFRNGFGAKLKDGACVLYFRDRGAMLQKFHAIQDYINKSGFSGAVKWVKACRPLRNLLPELWSGDKEFVFGD